MPRNTCPCLADRDPSMTTAVSETVLPMRDAVLPTQEQLVFLLRKLPLWTTTTQKTAMTGVWSKNLFQPRVSVENLSFAFSRPHLHLPPPPPPPPPPHPPPRHLPLHMTHLACVHRTTMLTASLFKASRCERIIRNSSRP